VKLLIVGYGAFVLTMTVVGHVRLFRDEGRSKRSNIRHLRATQPPARWIVRKEMPQHSRFWTEGSHWSVIDVPVSYSEVGDPKQHRRPYRHDDRGPLRASDFVTAPAACQENKSDGIRSDCTELNLD
jgi:hypothetical protein